MNDQDHIKAHEHSSHHKAEITASIRCGCFCCLKIFPPTDIKEWVDGDDTAVCPHCDTDSVIGTASGYMINEDLLTKMRKYWF